MSLPSRWTKTALGNLSSLVTSGSRGWAQYYADQGSAFIRVQNVQRGRVQLDLVDVQHVSPPSGAEGERTRLRHNDILVSITADLGRIGIFEANIPAYINQHVAMVRLIEPQLAPFIARYLTSTAGQTDLGLMDRGVTRAGLGLDDIRAVPIPLAPLAEQRRIVAKLDALFVRLARARRELERLPWLANRIRETALARAYSGAMLAATAPEYRACESWITSTFYGPRFGKEQYVQDGVPTIRTTDFCDDGTIHIDDAPRVDCAPPDLAKWGLEDGDLLVTRTGSIGKCAVYHPGIGRALPSAYLIRVRFDRQILPRFAWMMFASPQGQAHLTGNSRAVTQPNINASMIRSLSFPIFDLDQQAEIVQRVDRQMAHADRLEAEAARARALLDRLEAAILSKAFKGELVAQDPNDEPASALLDRIKASRVQKLQSQPKRGGKATAPKIRRYGDSAPSSDRIAATVEENKGPN